MHIEGDQPCTQRPLATVVVGSMLLGPVMLLVVVPSFRMLFLKDDDDLSKDVPSPQTGGHP